jgi:hypothetical protein
MRDANCQNAVPIVRKMRSALATDHLTVGTRQVSTSLRPLVVRPSRIGSCSFRDQAPALAPI